MKYKKNIFGHFGTPITLHRKKALQCEHSADTRGSDERKIMIGLSMAFAQPTSLKCHQCPHALLN